MQPIDYRSPPVPQEVRAAAPPTVAEIRGCRMALVGFALSLTACPMRYAGARSRSIGMGLTFDSFALVGFAIAWAAAIFAVRRQRSARWAGAFLLVVLSLMSFWAIVIEFMPDD